MEKLMEAVVADESGARRTFEAVQEDTGEVVWREQRSGRPLGARGADAAEAACEALRLWREQGLKFLSISWTAA
jgi:hypothetical protein